MRIKRKSGTLKAIRWRKEINKFSPADLVEVSEMIEDLKQVYTMPDCTKVVIVPLDDWLWFLEDKDPKDFVKRE